MPEFGLSYWVHSLHLYNQWCVFEVNVNTEINFYMPEAVQHSKYTDSFFQFHPKQQQQPITPPQEYEYRTEMKNNKRGYGLLLSFSFSWLHTTNYKWIHSKSFSILDQDTKHQIQVRWNGIQHWRKQKGLCFVYPVSF